MTSGTPCGRAATDVVDTFPAGRRPSAIAADDASGDGAAELFVSGALSDIVSVYVHDGDQSWRAPGSYATGGEPLAVATADFDHDLRLDAVTADARSNSMTVLFGR